MEEIPSSDSPYNKIDDFQTPQHPLFRTDSNGSTGNRRSRKASSVHCQPPPGCLLSPVAEGSQEGDTKAFRGQTTEKGTLYTSEESTDYLDSQQHYHHQPPAKNYPQHHSFVKSNRPLRDDEESTASQNFGGTPSEVSAVSTSIGIRDTFMCHAGSSSLKSGRLLRTDSDGCASEVRHHSTGKEEEFARVGSTNWASGWKLGSLTNLLEVTSSAASSTGGKSNQSGVLSGASKISGRASPTGSDAIEALPLPSGWTTARRVSDGKIYYWEIGTGQTSWIHPMMGQKLRMIDSDAIPEDLSIVSSHVEEKPLGESSSPTRGVRWQEKAVGVDDEYENTGLFKASTSRKAYLDTPGNSSEAQMRPASHLCCAVVSLVMCPPLGVCAFFHSRMVKKSWREARYTEAFSHSTQSYNYSFFAIAVSVIVLTYLTIFQQSFLIRIFEGLW